MLLAHIVEHACGEPYRQFLSRRIFEPLDLHDTFVGSPNGRTGLATGYTGTTATPSFELNSVGMGAGDIWSTTADLVRWDRALAAGSFLDTESRRLTFTPHARTGAERQLEAYGYGWQLGRIAGHPVHCHSGGNAGFTSFNAWFPHHSAYVVVLTNNDEIDTYELTVQLTESHLPRT